MLDDIRQFSLVPIDLSDGRLRSCWNDSITVVTAITLLFISGFPPVLLASGEAGSASLEIEVSTLDMQPVLLFLQAEKNVVDHVLSPDAGQPRITSTKLQFEPPLQILPVGSTIEVVNQDPVLHNTHVFSGSHTLFNVATPNAESTVRRTLSRPGLFGVRCDLHPSMKAWIAVVSDVNYVVIDRPGDYRIDDIEPGRYRVHIERPERKDQVIEIELVAAEARKIRLSR